MVFFDSLANNISTLILENTEVNKKVKTECDVLSSSFSTVRRATDEQKVGIEETTKAISTLNLSTQENASSAEEVAAGAQSIANTATDLVGKVKEFTII